MRVLSVYLDLDEMIYTFDSDTYWVLFEVYGPWAKFYHKIGAINMHTFLKQELKIICFTRLLMVERQTNLSDFSLINYYWKSLVSTKN